jgi:hypothetical protein
MLTFSSGLQIKWAGRPGGANSKSTFEGFGDNNFESLNVKMVDCIQL